MTTSITDKAQDKIEETLNAEGRSASHVALGLLICLGCVGATAAIAAIRFARESGRPFLGTCGGFQHALLEHAESIWGVDAANAETNPEATDPVIAPLACARIDVADEIHLHCYDISGDVAAGGTVTLAFRATIPGRCEVELENRGIQIADITIEP